MDRKIPNIKNISYLNGVPASLVTSKDIYEATEYLKMASEDIEPKSGTVALASHYAKMCSISGDFAEEQFWNDVAGLIVSRVGAYVEVTDYQKEKVKAKYNKDWSVTGYLRRLIKIKSTFAPTRMSSTKNAS